MDGVAFLFVLGFIIVYLAVPSKTKTKTIKKTKTKNKQKESQENKNTNSTEKKTKPQSKEKINRASKYGWNDNYTHSVTNVHYEKFDFDIGGWSKEKVYIPYNNTEEYIHLHTGDMYNQFDLDHNGIKRKLKRKVVKTSNTNKKKESREEKLKSQYFENKKKYPFECSIIEKDDVFLVKSRGIISGPMDKSFDIKLLLELWDITKNRAIIRSIGDKYNFNNSTCTFEKFDSMNPNGSTFKYWKQLFSIPKKDLRFDTRGLRNIEFKLVASNPLNKRIFSTVQYNVEYNNTIKGYNEIDPKEDFEEAVIKTSMLISGVDGVFKDSEADVIKDWIRRRLDQFGDYDYDLEKDRMNMYIVESYKNIDESYLDIYDTLQMVDISASEVEKLELFQVCLDVAIADNEVHDLELEMIYDIADYLSLNSAHYRKMMEMTLPVHLHLGNTHIERTLGIDEFTDPIEIKKILLKEYKKWGNRVTHKNDKIRKQANKMIHLISEKRKEYQV